MPDTLAYREADEKNDSSAAGAGPFAAQADGFVVVASKPVTGSVVPPRRYQYWHEWRADLGSAAGHYADLERNEYDGWRAEAILPCVKGLPRHDLKLGPFTLARLVQETEAA